MADARSLGFEASCSPDVGALLRVLAATTRQGKILELGTGVGVSTTWILDGMSPDARLMSIEAEADLSAVAQAHLGDDSRVEFVVGDGAGFLEVREDELFETVDLIFADTWPGKFTHLGLALKMLSPGGVYLIDDLLPQSNWPEGHAPKVEALVDELASREELVLTQLNRATGVIIATHSPY